MHFRDKLARLSAPVSRAAAVPREREPRVERALEPELARELEPEASAGAEPARVAASNEHGGVRANHGPEDDGELERAERISHLRSLIGDVLARGAAWRAPRHDSSGLVDPRESGGGSPCRERDRALASVGPADLLVRSAASSGNYAVPERPESRSTRARPARLAPVERVAHGAEGTAAFDATAPNSARARANVLAAIALAARANALAFAKDGAFAGDGPGAEEGAFARDTSAARVGVDAGRDTTSYSLRTRAHRVLAPPTLAPTLDCEGGDGTAEGVDSRAHIQSSSRLHMLREAIDGWAPARGQLARVFARQPWATRETPFGPMHVVERWLEPAHLHGNVAVHSALERLPATVAALALDPELANLDFSRMLFLDTETTGLMGGSGTVAFLVGIASFHDDSLLLTQMLLPNLGGEAPMLRALADHLAKASCILTYNGKSFDWPLLRTRYVMNRLPVPALPPHVDLLHASRRIWKPRLGSVRLTDVEREIMRFSREGDVDGAEIPSRYFSFLRDGGTDWLVPVLEHNQNDLIALPAMLGVLGERFEQIECGDHALDALAYGRLALRVADGERAAAFALAAVTASEGSPLASQAWSFRGEVARRAREAEVAVQHYEQALELCDEELRSAALHVLLSKLYEHGLRDLRAAYRHARHTEPAEGPALQGRRLGRLTRKLERDMACEAKRRRALVPKRGSRAPSSTDASGEPR